jgi:hypothetical protein
VLSRIGVRRDALRSSSAGSSQDSLPLAAAGAFDTGFVCYHRGWHQLRREDLGLLWEHYVLNELHAHLQSRRVLYWRDKRGHEVDFIWQPRGGAPIAIECKWSAADFDPTALPGSVGPLWPATSNVRRGGRSARTPSTWLAPG